MTPSRVLVWLALVLGLVHAASSLYWALGGTWLLRTVGEWAVELAESPVQRALVLGPIALVKAVAATVPVLVAYERVPWRRFWRGVSWSGGVLLLGYGGLNVVVSSAVLAGVIKPAGGYDVESMVGHALLWDPLFALWGAALIGSLWTSRPQRPSRPPRAGRG